MKVGDRKFEVIVLGGGIVGAAAAEALRRRGRHVLLVDRFEPGHGHGSSHGDGRIIRYTYPEEVYLRMAKLAYGSWERLQRDSGESLVQTTGSWECGLAGSRALEDLAENFRRFDIPHERLSAAESNRRFPCFHIAAGIEVLVQPEGGIVRAERSVRTLWRLAREAGVRCLTRTRVVAIDAEGDGVKLHCAAGEILESDLLVLAAGAWAPGLLRDLSYGLPLEVSDEVVAYYPPRPTGPDHRVGAMPAVIEHFDQPHFYALPQIDIPGVKIGWHRTGPTVDPDQRSLPGRGRLDSIARYARERFPHLGDEPLLTTTCLYTNTPDFHFVLDRHPKLSKIAIGTGFSGHGFKFGPVLGEILADLVLGEQPPVPLELFRSDRFQKGPSRPRDGA